MQALLASVRLPMIFGDNMVLQRGKPVPIWGWADTGEKVTVSFLGQQIQATADDSGYWRADLAPMEAMSTGTDFVVNASNTITFRNVVVGEVWLCSGQSNMEWPVRLVEEDRRQYDHDQPDIRFAKIHISHSGTPQTDLVTDWKVCTPDTVRDFSAVGIYFARRLHRELDVPIGLIGSYWGGTRIEAWISPLGFSKAPSLNSVLHFLNRLHPVTGHVYSKDEEVPGEDELLKMQGAHQRPSRIYNAMIAPLIPYAIEGVIWYQGEANGSDDDIYCDKMKALLSGWHESWAQGDFPFYYVQLANYKAPTEDPAGGDGWAKIREAQRKGLSLPNTGMVVTIDIGEEKTIHPHNKFDVGERLALWALAKDYSHADLVYSGPLYKSYSIEGETIRIQFDHIGSGLMVGMKSGLSSTTPEPHGNLKRFAIAGEDKQWHWADATIDGDTVVVSSSEVPYPVAVRYAYSMNPEEANLYNREGLPASPFRTDDW